MLTATFASLFLLSCQFVDDWQALWPNGIEGWEATGGKAKYSFDAGTLRGVGATGQNAHLKSPKEYSDFELAMEVKIQPGGNSGIQFRSHQKANGQVYGYQFELDPSSRAWSGGIYDEGRRAWLADLKKNERGRGAFRVGEWNRIRILCLGDRLRTWVNGILCADYVDDADASGFFAFQVHSGGKTDVSWRNARIREFSGSGPSEESITHGVARDALLSGVEWVPSIGTPGTVSIFGANAFPVLTGSGKNPLPLGGAAEWGQGRVFMMAHGYLSKLQGDPSQDGGARLMQNALAWVCHDKENPRTGEVKDSPESWQNADVLLWNGDPAMPPSKQQALRDWMGAGGGLLVGHCPWGWAQVKGKNLRQHMPHNQTLAPLGLVFGGGYNSPHGKEGYAIAKNQAHLQHPWEILQAMLAAIGEPKAENAHWSSSNSLEHAIASVPDNDEVLIPQLSRFLEKFPGQAPRPFHPLKASQSLSRLWVVLKSRLWLDLPPDQVVAFAGSEDFPGRVAATFPREEVQLSFSDFPPGWQSTPVYLPAGEVLTVRILEGSPKGWRLRIGCHKDSLWNKEVWSRWPQITHEVGLQKETTQVATPWGGNVYFVPGKGAGPIQVSVSGGVQAPFFVSGDPTSQNQWPQARQAPGPWAELVGKHVILSVPSASIRHLEDPQAVTDFWDNVAIGHSKLAARPPKVRPERLVGDQQISAGYMHSGYPIMTWLDVVTPRKGRPAAILDLETLGNKGNWGYFHEMGHNMQRGWWTFGGTGEVTNNLFSLHAGEEMAGIEPWNNPWLQGQKKSGEAYLANPDFAVWKRKPGVALLTFALIQREFGWEPFTRFFASFENQSKAERPSVDADKIDQWVLRLSKEVNRDLRPHFLEWGWPISKSVLQSADLSALPEWKADPSWMP